MSLIGFVAGLSGFAIFLSVAGIFLSLFMLLIPVISEKYDRFHRLARALQVHRVGYILAGTGSVASLLIASVAPSRITFMQLKMLQNRFITTISAWTEAGCKNAENDPNAKAGGKDFVAGLPNWCNTKKAGAIFFWLVFGQCQFSPTLGTFN